MLMPEGLLEIHERTHRNLRNCLAFCGELDADAIDRKMPEFNGTTIRLQLHHAIGAERYWVGVLQGRVDADEDDHLYPTLAAVEQFRHATFEATRKYVTNASLEELNTARPMKTWHGEEPMLYPGHVVMRTITHIYHHMGQVGSMLRLLGRESPGFNYPIK